GRRGPLLALLAGYELGPGELAAADGPSARPCPPRQLAQRSGERHVVAGDCRYLDVVAVRDADLAGRAERRAAPPLRSRRGGPRLQLVQVPPHHDPDGRAAGDDRAALSHDGLL